jgi:cation transport regulator ChaB
MPKKQDTTDMPSTIERSDQHAQDIWQETHDSAVETYGEGASAHRVAFASLKHEYEKEGDKWVKKDHKGPSDPQAERSSTSSKKSTDPDRAPTAGGKVAHGEKDARNEGREARHEQAEARKKS